MENSKELMKIDRGLLWATIPTDISVQWLIQSMGGKIHGSGMDSTWVYPWQSLIWGRFRRSGECLAEAAGTCSMKAERSTPSERPAGCLSHLRQGPNCDLNKGTYIIVNTCRIIKQMWIRKTLNVRFSKWRTIRA